MRNLLLTVFGAVLIGLVIVIGFNTLINNWISGLSIPSFPFALPEEILPQPTGVLEITIYVLAVFVAGFLLIYFVLAPRNKFFTFVPESKAKIVVRGDGVKKILFKYSGYAMDLEGNILQETEIPPQSLLRKSESRWTRLFGGLKWYGWWPLDDILVYKFRWTGIRESGEIIRREEWIDYILLRSDVYWMKLEKAEDKDLLPLDLEILLTLRVVNPYKALFNIQNWLEAVINRSGPLMREYIAEHKFEELIAKKQQIGGEMRHSLEERGVLEEFYNNYGIKVEAIEIKDINPPTEYREATLRPFVAEQDKKAIEIKAEAERERIQRVYKTVQEFGNLGQLIRTLEAVEKSPLAASLVVQQVPGLAEVLRGVFGRQPTDDEIKQLLKDIKDLLEDLLKQAKL
jgi:hypothetical protein